MTEDAQIERKPKPRWAWATGLSVLTGIPLSYGLDTGFNITEALVLPAMIGIFTFPGILWRIAGILYCYLIAIPSTFAMALLFMRALTHPEM